MRRIEVLIFAKYPEPGAVKTRLVPPLTAEQAADVHRAALLAVCELVAVTRVDHRLTCPLPDGRVSECPLPHGRVSEHPPPDQRVSDGTRATPGDGGVAIASILYGTPDARHVDFRRLLGDRVDDYRPQGDGPLGARLVRACAHSFQESALGGADPAGDIPPGLDPQPNRHVTPSPNAPPRRDRKGAGLARGDEGARADAVVLLGADSPTLPPGYLHEAIRRLTHDEMVFGPCEDGGYYLLALRRPLSVLFEGIDWGTPAVAAQTRRRAREAGVQWSELPVWYDLDRFDDLKRAARDLAKIDKQSRPAAAALGELIRRCGAR